MRSRIKLALVAAVAVTAAMITPMTTAQAAVQACGTSLTYQICLSAPSSTLTGDQPISVTVNGSSSGLWEIRFAWGPTTTSSNQLLSDFQAPWGFTWRTDKYLDGTQYLNARAELSNGTAGAFVSLPITLSNGNVSSVPTNPSDWAQLFQPRPATGDPVIAAVGDAGDGTVNSASVASMVNNSNASVLLYLGDLYERGTAAEFDYNYGRSSFEPGGGWNWGALARFTVPTIGNHEAFNLPTYRDYWHGRPDYSTFVYGGVRYIDVASECSYVGGCGTTSAQYQFVQSTLAANTLPCVVAFWHRPRLGSPNPDEPNMAPIWTLLANNGGDLVLNGHVHKMEIWKPLNGNLAAGQSDSHMVQVISGAGSHNSLGTTATDSRVAWQSGKTPGSLFVTAVGGQTGTATRLDFGFKDQYGATVMNNGVPGSGSVSCGASTPPDTNPPTPPGTPTGTSTVPGQIQLTWAAASDQETSSLVYRVYRDTGTTPIGTVTSSSTGTVSYTDQGLQGGTSHSYWVQAFDGVNVSPPSGTSQQIVVMSGPSAFFADDFSSGTFGQWTSNTRLTIDGSAGAPSAPSARGQVSNQSASAARNLSATYQSACMSLRINLASIGANSVDILRIRTAADGAIARVYVASNRRLWVRADFSGQQLQSSGTLPLATWTNLELCGDIPSGVWSLYMNGSRIAGPWTTSTGTTPIGRIQIGDTAAKTWTANIDDVILDSAPG